MNNVKKINVHHSSLVDLKAELLRKHEEVYSVTTKQESILSSNKNKMRNKNTKAKKEKQIDDKEENLIDNESREIYAKSKLTLEAKSQLYTKLLITQTNVNPNFLVDFKQKFNNLGYLEEKKKLLTNIESLYESDDEGLVEYTDCFGRFKKCSFEELPKLKEKDKITQQEILGKPCHQQKGYVAFVEGETFVVEPNANKMKKKWEAQSEKLINKNEIHYQDVLFDEARTHGVGYFAFSQDKNERIKQQENLIKLRKETELKQRENKEINHTKLQIQQNRLQIARLRQRVRTRLPSGYMKEKKCVFSMTDMFNHNKDEVERKKQVNTNIQVSTSQLSCKCVKRKFFEIDNKIESFGKLLGTKNEWYVMTQQEWIDEKRKERKLEFGPTYNQSKTDTSDLFLSMSNNHEISKSLPCISSDSSATKPLSPLTISKISDSEIDNLHVGNQIEAGLKYLRQQFENKKT